MAPKRGTPEHDLWCKRISVANKGKSRSEETKRRIGESKAGKRNPFYGKHLSAEHRRKISITLTGRQFSDAHCRKLRETQAGERNPNYGKHHSAETKRKISMAMSGPKSHFWRGGISFEPYPVEWNALLRESIRKRDNYICVLCGKTQGKRRLEVHHINYVKADLRPENLITLCTTCHRKTNGDREYWINLFQMVYVPDFPKRRKNESNC